MGQIRVETWAAFDCSLSSIMFTVRILLKKKKENTLLDQITETCNGKAGSQMWLTLCFEQFNRLTETLQSDTRLRNTAIVHSDAPGDIFR